MPRPRRLTAPPPPAYASRLETLPGGLRVATCEMPHAETAAFGIIAAVGSRHEPARLGGASHFIEHMLFKGTARRSARRIMEEIEGVGGDINAYTSEERTVYYGTVAAEFFPRLCDVVCDFYANAKFAPTDVERERDVIGEEILMYRDEPASHVQELLNENFWGGHPIGRPITGTSETLAGISREDLLGFRKAHYHRAATIVCAAGRISHEDVVERAKDALSSLPAGKPRRQAPSPEAGTFRLVTEQRDTQQTQVAIGFPAPSFHCDDRFALHIANTILGGNGSSRLFQQLREKRGLCYSVSTHPSLFSDSGQFAVSVGLEARNLAKSLALIRDEIEKLASRPPSPAEFQRAKDYIVGTNRMALERSSSQCSRVGGSVLAYGRIVDPEESHLRLREVTPAEISACTDRYLDPSRATVAIIGPNPEAADVRKILLGA